MAASLIRIYIFAVFPLGSFDKFSVSITAAYEGAMIKLENFACTNTDVILVTVILTTMPYFGGCHIVLEAAICNYECGLKRSYKGVMLEL